MLSASQMMAGNIFKSILDVFNRLGSFTYNERNDGLQMIFFVSLGVFVLSIVICLLAISRTYESKLLKCVSGFNRYFKKNPNITEENLVEVNSRFKRVPKTLRYSWQEYMLNRDRKPSEYINTVSCIDQPTKSSAYKNISNTVLLITIMVSIITIFANLVCVYVPTVGPIEDPTAPKIAIGTFEGLFEIFMFPFIYLFVGLFIVTFLRLLESSRYADLYYEFHEFERYLDKACQTMPAFVDYEVLFTPKEISSAIPVLKEYLDKRALQEQKEAEEAEMNANHFESFNFDPVGVESALLLDRAMLEGEKYFNFRRSLTERINAREQEMFNYQKNFDEVTKDFERKSQAVRESMSSINEQLNATSVKIEANYLKKRLNEEQQKQQQLEKDYEYAKLNFTKQQQEMEHEISDMNTEIKEKKAQVEENMMSECRNYANKVWGEINKTIQEQQAPILKEKEEKAVEMQEELDRMVLVAADQDAEIRSKQEYILKLEQDIRVRMAEIEAINNVRDYFNTSEFRQRVSDKKKKRKSGEYDFDEPEIISGANNNVAQIMTSDNRQDDINREQNDILNQLRDINKANSEYSDQVDEINERKEREANKEVNPFAAFTSIQNDIEKENNEYINNQNDLATSVDNTIKAVEENKSETPVEKKKPSLQGLLDSAKKLKK